MTGLPFAAYRLTLTPLTPIHVGGGWQIEPIEYDLIENEDGDGGALAVLDLPALLAGLSPAERAEWARLTEGPLRDIKRWLRRRYEARHVRFEIDVGREAFTELSRHDDDPARRGVVEVSARHAVTGGPYLPGSSVKGAIRTALVSAAAGGAARSDLQTAAAAPGGGSARFEAVVLGHLGENGRPNLYRDRLRQMAISDAPLPENAARVERVQLVRLGPGSADPGGIVIYRDVTFSEADMVEGALDATAEVRLHQRLGDRQVMGQDRCGEPVTVEAIRAACNGFYLPKLESELQRFGGLDRATTDLLREAAGTIRDNGRAALIRLGRHSHYECVTVAPYARPKGGKSRTYVNGKVPLGWCRMEFGEAVP